MCHKCPFHFAEAKENLQRQRTEATERVKNGRAVELVVDGPSLIHILKKEQSGTKLEELLAELASLSGAVIVCRSSPSQKAAIVRLMDDFEMRKAEGTGSALMKWIRRQNKKVKGKSLAIGDGANDVAMIQAANVGIGIAGKEGRQAVNNSDYAISQFRFVVRLLLVHGQLSHYRLARLIKYSFFKNIAFAFILIYFQFFCGFSGKESAPWPKQGVVAANPKHCVSASVTHRVLPSFAEPACIFVYGGCLRCHAMTMLLDGLLA